MYKSVIDTTGKALFTPLVLSNKKDYQETNKNICLGDIAQVIVQCYGKVYMNGYYLPVHNDGKTLGSRDRLVLVMTFV